MRLTAVVLALVLAGPSPARIISQASVAGKVVALTFDAGADRGYAPRILRTLERAHIHASFGMTGRWAQQNPDLVRRMARDGDQFIDHTFDHRSFTGLSTHTAPLTVAQRTWEIKHADAIIHHLTGKWARPYFRPPFGDYDAATPVLAGRLGYRYMIMWTVDSLGWEGVSTATIITRVQQLTQPGDIILMHVGSQSRDGLALRAVLHELRSAGYRFVTVAQLVTGR